MIGRVAVAINPTSGNGAGARAAAQVLPRLAAAGIRADPLTGPDAGALAAAARQAVAAGVDALVVVGGDGMVHLGTDVVAGTGTPLAVVAAGTGNDLARELALPIGDAATLATGLVRILTADRVRAVDAVRCAPVPALGMPPGAPAHRWFAGVLCGGFDALVNERANGWRRPRGRLRYDLATLRELPALRAREYRLELDGEPWPVPAVLVAVANAPSFGGGLRICPSARMDDGLLDVVVVGPMSRTALVRIYPRVFAGRHVDDPRVRIRRARQVSIDTAGIVGYADGERLAALPLHCELVPGALRVLVDDAPA